ncbi:MAG: transcriptional antiterminator RfaH [Halopseudomonas sp.]|jgi:transcriptional antiterminator RfaH
MESAARDNLERQGYEVCLPEIRVRKRRGGRWQSVVEPLFPGYLFVALDLESDNTAPIKSTVGVRGLVRFGLRSPRMPAGSVEMLRDNAAGVEAAPLPFATGDSVRIVRGPFAGLEAVYQMRRGEERVQVLLAMLGREHLIGVEIDDLEV